MALNTKNPPARAWRVSFQRALTGEDAPASTAMALAVAASAGKNASIVTSDRVTSTAVPNTVVVLRKESGPALARQDERHRDIGMPRAQRLGRCGPPAAAPGRI